MNFLITGGAGFIGSALIRLLLQTTSHQVLNIDKLTYAGSLASVALPSPAAKHSNAANSEAELSNAELSTADRYQFLQADINDMSVIAKAFHDFKPDIVIHLAAESHVDRSIEGAAPFIQTNIVGTYSLLETARSYYLQLSAEKQACFRFHHVSTDEVFGDLAKDAAAFDEQTPYAPSSPYSASKAASDHLVRAWHRTYGLPIVLSNCSNNYGPYQYPEKLIPRMIIHALQGLALPVYGDGQQIRDWLHVDDHARALLLVATQGKIGETYLIGGNCQQSNLAVVEQLCQVLNELVTEKPTGIDDFSKLIQFVTDRPGHDVRYAVNCHKITTELGWSARQSFKTGLHQTIRWYLDNSWWWQAILPKTAHTGHQPHTEY